MAFYVLLFLLIGLPLVYFPWISLAFEPPKVIIFEFLASLLLFLKLWRERISWSKYNKPLLISLIALLLLSLIQIFIYSSKQIFLGNIFRFQGTVLLWNLLLFAFVSSSITIKSIPKLIYLCAFIVLFISTLLIGPNQSYRWMGPLGEPNALASLIVFLLPFTLLQTSRVVQYVIWTISLVLIGLSGSMSGLLALGIQIFFLVLYKYFKFSLNKTVLICLIIILFSYILPFIEKGGVYENRSEIWLTSFYTVLKNPLIGSGFGNTEYVLKNTAEVLKNPMRFQYVDSAHNILLDWAIQGGVVGFILLIFIVYQTLKALIHKKYIYLLLAFLGILTTASFNPLNINSLIAFWWLISQGLEDYNTSH